MDAPKQIDRRTPPIVGRHVLLDLYEVHDERLTDAAALESLFVRLLDACGFHRLAVRSHQFPGAGAGATVIALLSESHATIHTYPEYAYAAVDVFSCGAADVDSFVAQLAEQLQSQRFTCREEARGGSEDQS